MAMPTLESGGIDPETGFLDSPIIGGRGFNAQMKKRFVYELVENNPSPYQVAKSIGVSIDTVHEHMKRDKAFRDKIEEAKRHFAWRVEGVLAHCALDEKKTLDRLAFLRAYMPEKYARQEVQGPAAVINVTVSSDVAAKLSKTVDAEVVDANVESANSGQSTKHADNNNENR